MAQQQAEETQSEFVEEPEDKAPEKAAPAVVREDDEGNVIVSDPEKPKRKPRAERREERQNDGEVARLRAELVQRDAYYAQQIAQLSARSTQTPEDPHKREVLAIRSEQENIQAMIRQAQTPAEAERLRARFYELNDKTDELNRAKIRSELLNEMRQQQNQAPSGAAEEAILRAEFSDVIANQSAVRWAKGLYDQMCAEGHPPTLVTSRAALAKAGERFGVRQATAPAPTPVQQQRYGAVPAQAGAGAQGGDMVLSTRDMKLARARWPDLEEKDAYRKLAALLRSSAQGEAAE